MMSYPAISLYTAARREPPRRREIRIEQFLSRHILLAWLVCCVGVPIGLLASVTLFTCAAVLPIALLMGW